MYVLDTNVVSELRKASIGMSDRGVSIWAAQVPANNLYVSTVTIEELEIGVLRMGCRDPRQGAMLRVWIDEVVQVTFKGRILPVDLAVAQRSARLHVPDQCPIRDGFIAATALVHGMTVVTRNVADFKPMGVPVLNPWQA
jgi:predicted nucleic acid-binding protein